jgi:hypothetical protein
MLSPGIFRRTSFIYGSEPAKARPEIEGRLTLKSQVKINVGRAGAALILLAAASMPAMARESDREVLVVTSTNNPAGNDVAVFRLNTAGTPSLTLLNTLPTGGVGGAGGNAGSVQFRDGLGAVANYGSNTISQLVRIGNFVVIGQTIRLANGCANPVSVALSGTQLFVAGANCIESHAWPSGIADGTAVKIADTSAAQVVVGQTWAAVTMKSGSVLQLPLNGRGALAGPQTPVTLPANANNTPLGAAFWGDTLGFNAAHSPDSFVLVDENRDVFPVAGPQPSYPANAPCWLAKGPGNIWYSGNSPGHAISIFFSDSQGGAFYKSVALPGTPTDITVSGDRKWLAVIYTAADGSGARIAVYSIDGQGDLTLAATSGSIGVASFNGVAFSD